MICDTTYTARGDTDPRVAELQELATTQGLKIAVAIDMVLWLEDRGYVVDLCTGVAMRVSIERVTPLGITINHLLSPVTDDDVEQTINGLFTATSEEVCEPDGTLQGMIDAGKSDESWYEAELLELVDGRFDDEYHASGNW